MIQIFELIAILFTVTGLFIWNRSESRSDYRRCEDLISAIKDEMKDFHGRLCELQGGLNQKGKK